MLVTLGKLQFQFRLSPALKELGLLIVTQNDFVILRAIFFIGKLSVQKLKRLTCN